MIIFKNHSGIYSMTLSQELNTTIEKAWYFFSNPDNLSKITPKHMGFHITSGNTDKMYPGQIISYRFSPIPGFKTNWVTEITQVQNEKFFIDEQRFGPYKMWHHEHHFKQNNDKVVMTDKLYYKLPYGFIGRLVHTLFIKNEIRKIFMYRYNKLQQIFKLEE